MLAKLLVAALAIIGIAAYTSLVFAPAPDDSITRQPTSRMEITSPAFAHEGSIPSKYTCDSETMVSVPLTFENVPEGTVSLVLLADDPDVPKEVRPDGVFDHWTLFNISPEAPGIPEGGSIGRKGLNGRGTLEYRGPCPPPEYEPKEHRYFFRLYALDTALSLPEGATKAQVLEAMRGHVIETAELMGRYARQ